MVLINTLALENIEDKATEDDDFPSEVLHFQKEIFLDIEVLNIFNV